MKIQPSIRSNIFTNSHPLGCKQNIQNQINEVRDLGTFEGPKNVLIIGGSSGYGLSSRIALAFGSDSNTVNVSYESAPKGKRTGSAGWWNNIYFQELASSTNNIHKDFVRDAFSKETKLEVINYIKENLDQIGKKEGLALLREWIDSSSDQMLRQIALTNYGLIEEGKSFKFFEHLFLSDEDVKIRLIAGKILKERYIHNKELIPLLSFTLKKLDNIEQHENARLSELLAKAEGKCAIADCSAKPKTYRRLPVDSETTPNKFEEHVLCLKHAQEWDDGKLSNEVTLRSV